MSHELTVEPWLISSMQERAYFVPINNTLLAISLRQYGLVDGDAYEWLLPLMQTSSEVAGSLR